MTDLIITLFALTAPMLLLFIPTSDKITGKTKKNGHNPVWELLGGLTILASIASGGFLFVHGTTELNIVQWEGLGLGVRLDPLSVTMFIMIALLGYIVLRFSNTYLDGDSRKEIFMRRLAVTIASVQLLVLAGNLLQIWLFWVATSICLHYLLTFYHDRPQAQAAARKKFLAARLGDLSLLAAVILIYQEFGTGQLSVIFDELSTMNVIPAPLTVASVLLAVTALLKSAQFPLYGWLIEVVETPTPVSALLHAGLLNAGPFLIVRMSYLIGESVPASLVLIAVGGFTALFASVVFLTQPSIKIALGYSSIAHMGFMLLICGFGVYTAAILHLVAHSFYKAHAFLSSGSVVDQVRASGLSLPTRKGSPIRIALSIGFAMLIYGALCILWDVHPTEDFTLMATGAIIVMGLSQIIVPAVDTDGDLQAMFKSGGLALAVATAFFTLEHGAHLLLHTQIPAHTTPALPVVIAVVMVLVLFAATVIIQLSAPAFKTNEWTYRLGVHLRNGLYANLLFDRITGSLKKELRNRAMTPATKSDGHVSDIVSKEKIDQSA